MALRNRRDGNREAIGAFAEQFDPPLKITATKAVGGVAVTNGWMAAFHDPVTELGVTAVVWGGGHMKIWMEVQTTAAEAASFGDFFAGVMDAATREDEEIAPSAGQVSSDAEWLQPQRYEGRAPDEDNRRKEPAGLVSDRMEGGEFSIIPDKVFRKADVPYREGPPIIEDWSGGQAAIKGWSGSRPNPDFVDAGAGAERLVDMAKLDRETVHRLVTRFPALAFAIDSHGSRFRIDGGKQILDPDAGFCPQSALDAIGSHHPDRAARTETASRMPPRRSIPRMPPAAAEPVPETRAPTRMGAPMRKGCDHTMVRNSIGGGYTCSKCGGYEPSSGMRERQAAANAERRLAEAAEREAACLKERGAHSLIRLDQGDQAVGVCQFCGVQVPWEETAVLEAPAGSQDPSV